MSYIVEQIVINNNECISSILLIVNKNALFIERVPSFWAVQMKRLIFRRGCVDPFLDNFQLLGRELAKMLAFALKLEKDTAF